MAYGQVCVRACVRVEVKTRTDLRVDYYALHMGLTDICPWCWVPLFLGALTVAKHR